MKIQILILLLTCIVGAITTVTPNTYCYNDYPILDGLLCYPECASGYSHWGGGPVCWGTCPPHTTDIGLFCIKHTYGRGVGNVLSTCTDTHDLNGALCYPKCNTGYYGVGPVCWAYCKEGYTDDGALCRRNTHIYGRDVDSCPWYDKCGLCGGPWYNVCGQRRNCGRDCKSGYHNDGCTCRRDVHIYAKDTYGRGVGSPMGCKDDEELDGALCYKQCESGYYGVGPVCWARCSGKTIDTGTQCQKEAYGRGVGKVVNCLQLPSAEDLTDFNGLVTMFKKVDGIQNLQAATCATLYTNIKFWITLIGTFNRCFAKGNWQTLSLSYTAGAASAGEMAGEIGIAVDTKSRKAMCYVGYCYGLKADVSIGAEINIGLWRTLGDIPGESKAWEFGVDVPTTEIGASVNFISNTDDEYIGTVFAFGVGVGGPLPIDIGNSKCFTPEDKTIPFDI